MLHFDRNVPFPKLGADLPLPGINRVYLHGFLYQQIFCMVKFLTTLTPWWDNSIIPIIFLFLPFLHSPNIQWLGEHIDTAQLNLKMCPPKKVQFSPLFQTEILLLFLYQAEQYDVYV